MKRSIKTWSAVLATAAVLAGCGGSSSNDEPPVTPPPTATIGEKLAAAAKDAANDAATSSSAPFTVLQTAGVPAVTVQSPPVVNFAVFSDGAPVTGLTTSNARLIIAKLIPPADGNPHRWESYITRVETATAGVGPNGTPVLTSAVQATTDSGGTLAYNEAGYYTYTFKTDIKDVAATRGVTFDATKTHRVAIQLSYKNAAGETVLVNPYFDFRFDADGKSVPVTDPALTFKMTDVTSCNGCHEKLALHGGGRVDTQFCVMCHNPGTTDANSGNVLTLSTMAHKIHSGRLLKTKLDAGQGGEDYTIWGYRDSKHDYAEVGFPQDLRNCTKCHSGSNAATPQGDNWKTTVSSETCLTCHANKPGSNWYTGHTTYAGTLVGAGAVATQLTNAQCNECHKPGSNIASERVHWNQNEENAAKYKMVIESATFNDTADHTGRTVTVKYSLVDPTNGNAAYDLVTSECTGSGASASCANTTKFGNLRFYVTYPSMVGQTLTTTEYTSYNNGGNSANAYAYKGTNDGSNRYTLNIPLPNDSATHAVQGTAMVVSIGQVKEPQLQVKWATDPRPEVSPRTLINTVVQNTSKEFVISGALSPRRTIVSNEKCNVCHAALGTTSGSNTLASAFHSGARNTVEACLVCHDPNRMSSTIMTNGLALNENYQFKRMIHGIHGNSKRTYPFTHGNRVVDAFNKDGTSATGGAPLASGVENYAAEVAWPGVGLNCNACHINNSYKLDNGPVGSVATKPSGVTDPLDWFVISPKAASCTACHDSSAAMGHVTSFGQASFADRTQRSVMFGPASQTVVETCNDCHASGGFKGVDLVHGQK